MATPAPGPPPSTTIPIAIDDRGCAGGPTEVAERVLIERRQGSAVPPCQAPGAAPAIGTAVCWSSCEDGRVFVDHDLDTTHPPAERIDPATGTSEIVVPYTARYRHGEQVTIAAESIVLRRSDDDRSWNLVAVEAVDLDGAIDAAWATAEQFFGALRDGDHRRAASLMVGESGWSEAIADRDDLARLADEGVLTGTSVDDVAAALAAWCAGGAACEIEPQLDVEITPTHGLRIVVTSAVDLGTYDTTLRIVDGMIEGLPIKVG